MTLLLVVAVYLVSCPAEVVLPSSLLTPCIDILTQSWQSSNSQVWFTHILMFWGLKRLKGVYKSLWKPISELQRPAIWHHTLLPATRHRWTRSVSTPAKRDLLKSLTYPQKRVVVISILLRMADTSIWYFKPTECTSSPAQHWKLKLEIRPCPTQPLHWKDL